MKKKTAKKTSHKKSVSTRRLNRKEDDTYVILVRSWVFLVMFAIMMGVGVIVGNYINHSLNGSPPTVAGVSTDR